MIDYNGSGQPVPDGTMVRVQLRKGLARPSFEPGDTVATANPVGLAQSWFWEWLDDRDEAATFCEIVAYEIVD